MCSSSEVHKETIQLILTLLQGMRYGAIEIVIHDGRVVQIERKEKFRPASETSHKEDTRDGSHKDN
ncbi:MAG TPA: YezD family protein [Chthonomonas sp.]|uniref:YezD family protein n=1 Tax=Chthonomonas sp. TaxID=2282153 RepID=UPI002B4ABD7B|nr:YezD family protein [Chthonomonas sp.]HLI48371.1 YezD family protein [Chthonomonas sp.]